MNIVLVIICVIVALIAGIILYIVVVKDKFTWLIIKLNKGEKKLKASLEKKYNILLQYFEYLKDKITIDEEDLEEYKLFNIKSPIKDINKKIMDLNNIINQYMIANEKLSQEKELKEIDNDLSNINITINSTTNYYNKNLEEYNNLCMNFPYNLVALIFKYHTKELIDIDTEETLKILNQDE